MITDKKYTLTRYACYMTNVSMAAIATLSPLLFETFRNTYGISYTLLGLLVLINFCTQLGIDLIFSFFPKKFNIELTVRLTPAITVAGILIYSLMPLFFPAQAYVWLVIGTIIFSASAGLSEVLMSPVIAAMPSDNPEREMSKLHSLYAWGVVGVVILNALFIKFIGAENWNYIALFWAIVPLTAFILFLKSNIPHISTENQAQKSHGGAFLSGIMLFVLCIFMGGAAENTMTQWISSYTEKALGISKFWGDICGMALFAAMLGLGRTVYAKFGKNITTVLLLGFIGATACYIIAGLSTVPIVGLIACVLSGLCVSMLWPGSIIVSSDKFPNGGVIVFALMAAGGDLGGSVAPQLMGIISDSFAETELAMKLAEQLSVTTEQIGLKAGMLIATIFPIMGICIVLIIKKFMKKPIYHNPPEWQEDKSIDLSDKAE